MDFDVPDEPEWVEVDLVEPGVRAAPDDSAQPPDIVRGRLSISTPLIRPVDLDDPANDDEVCRYLRQELTHYDAKILAFACNFRSADVQFVKAAVSVSLTRQDGSQDGLPTAWRLAPRTLTRPAHQRPRMVSFEFGLTLKFVIETGVPQPVDGGERVLIADGEGSSTPEWIFQRTRHADFDGIHWLGMLLLLPRGTRSTARIALSAFIQGRKLAGLVPYTAALPPQVQTTDLN